MKVKWGVSIVFGVIAFILTFCFSIVNNTWLPSLFRAVIGFLLFAILGYWLRFVLCSIVSMKKIDPIPKQNSRVASPLETEQGISTEEDSNDKPLFKSIPLESLHKEKNSQ